MVTKIFSDGPEEQVVLTGMAALMLHAIVQSRGPLISSGSDAEQAAKRAFDLAEAFMAEAKGRAK